MAKSKIVGLHLWGAKIIADSLGINETLWITTAKNSLNEASHKTSLLLKSKDYAEYRLDSLTYEGTIDA